MAVMWHVARRVRDRWKAVLAVSVGVSLLQAVVAAPIVALLVRLFLASTGKASVGNFEIARFFLSPLGIFSLLVISTIALAGIYMQLAALLRVLGDPPASGADTLRGLLRGGHRLLRLGGLQIGTVLLIAAPLLVAMMLIVKGMWGDRDLNGLLVLKPPVFWQGVAAAAVPALVLAFLLVFITLRWLFALPILLEERGLRPFGAIRQSAQRTRGRHLRHLWALVRWGLVAFLLGAALQAAVTVPGAWLLGRVGPSMNVALPVTALVVALWWLAVLVSSWLSLALLAGVVDRLHREATERPPATALVGDALAPRAWFRTILLGLGVLLAMAALGGWWLLRTQPLTEEVEITAHRMGAIAAPENTIAALRRAIVEKAEWAELDVQLTSDGALVVLHDFDLVRIGGPQKRVAEATLEEVRAIDVGKALGIPGFDGERVPTLDEVIAEAGDKIGLNIELKPPTPAADIPLTDAVLAVVRKAGLVGRCRLCSQSYEAMRHAKKAEPKLTVGFIAGAAIGNLSRLEVDFLMLNAGLATGRFVREAHARGIKVHPWTVNDPDALAGLLDRGVDNVITDRPAEMRARLEELRALSPPDRLLLRVRNLLAD
jgi:glycerophosphoryl diester phosphodiesterase